MSSILYAFIDEEKKIIGRWKNGYFTRTRRKITTEILRNLRRSHRRQLLDGVKTKREIEKTLREMRRNE